MPSPLAAGDPRLRFRQHDLPGTLVVIEGVARAGKSTIVARAAAGAAERSRACTTTGWNSHPVVQRMNSHLKAQGMLTPYLFHLTHLLDLAARHRDTVVPALERGELVIADRYLHTSVVRDGLRGIDASMVAIQAPQFVQPDLAVLVDTPIDVVMRRYDDDAKEFGDHGCGLDLRPGWPRRAAFEQYTQDQRAWYRALAAAGELIVCTDPSDVVDLIAAVVERNR